VLRKYDDYLEAHWGVRALYWTVVALFFAGIALFFFTTDSAHTRAASVYLAGVLIVLASSRPSFTSILTVWKSLVRAKQHARFWWVRVFGLAIALAGVVLLLRMEETTGLEEILIMFVLLYLFYERIAGVSTSDLTEDQQTRDRG